MELGAEQVALPHRGREWCGRRSALAMVAGPSSQAKLCAK